MPSGAQVFGNALYDGAETDGAVPEGLVSGLLAELERTADQQP